MAFARLSIIELSSQCRGAAAAQPMTHDQDLLDIELGDRELERGRNAVIAAGGLIRWSERGDVAHDEHLAGTSVENLRRVDAAVGARQDHHPRALALGKLRPALAFVRPVLLAKPAVSLDQLR